VSVCVCVVDVLPWQAALVLGMFAVLDVIGILLNQIAVSVRECVCVGECVCPAIADVLPWQAALVLGLFAFLDMIGILWNQPAVS
jgi:hypothetical protein